MINLRMWIRATFTLLIFGSFAYILGLLFSSDRTLDDKFRDLLNIIVGSFLALPLVIVLVVGAVVFGAYKIGINDTDEPYDMNNMYRTSKRYKDDD